MKQRIVAILFLASLQEQSTFAHMRLECPPPRSGNTGEKKGPCDAPDDLSLPAYPLIPNALNTITWLESIGHPGAPLRVALSLEGMDDGFEECLLLDHIPHDEQSRPSYRDESTYHRSSITLWIPDIYCERCHLQLISLMTDLVHGVPDDTYCVYNPAKEAGLVANPDLPACPAVYHSCAPVSINGTIPRNQIRTCNTQMIQEEMLDWPFMKSTNMEKNQNYSTYYAKGNPGMFNQTDATLLSGGMPGLEGCTSYSYCNPETYFEEAVVVPATARYTAMAGTCASMVGMKVEPFVLGKLPDQMMFEVEMMKMDTDYYNNNTMMMNVSISCDDNDNCTDTMLSLHEDQELATSRSDRIEAGVKEDDGEVSEVASSSCDGGVGWRSAAGGLALLSLLLASK